MTSDHQIGKRPGMLFVWTNVDPAYEEDFNRWYDREHVDERVRIPGFVSGARYQVTQGARRYLGLYRTTSLDVFKTQAYFQAFQKQTPWSVSNLARMHDPMRRVCEINWETGAGTGAWLAVVRCGNSAIGRQLAEVTKLGRTLREIDAVVSSKLLFPDLDLSTPLPAENPSGRILDPILLIEASSEPAAANAGRFAAEQIGAEVDSLSILQLTWQLRKEDLRDEAT